MAVCGYKTIWKLVNKTTNVKGVALRSAHRLRRRLEPTLYSHVRKTVPPPGGNVFSTDQNHFRTQEVTYPLHKHFGKVNVTSRNSVEFHEDRTRNAVSSVHNAKVHDGHRSIKYHHEH
ncbi:hypothetical protein DPMN_045907 [Dreissena polymorpha]|uniref:Uncharacterized protein n=1 Tax=Dreissena polymorpha TaxID=45954 RepID=A0A9D4D6X6_DREPO|nr:hypothetical protein DPMN_045907 [Dreissena polymorpha]